MAYEYVSDREADMYWSLSERLMRDRFVESMAEPLGAEAVNGMFVQDALLEAEDC